MALSFWKYEGAGNDFVVLDGREGGFDPQRETVCALCDRHFGIGADGLMILEKDPQAQFRMRYFNADGGESTMCGNGGRCIALFAEHLGIGDRIKHFNGSDGPHTAEIVSLDDRNGGVVTLHMIPVESVFHEDQYFFLNTGSPHYVEFVKEVDAVDVYALGREIRYSESFAEIGGTNVNFVEITGDGKLRIRTYERGVENETLACGTGATAAAIAAYIYRQSHRTRFELETRGGRLEVSFSTPDGLRFEDIRLTGPAKKIFSGTIEPDFLTLK